MTHAQFLRIKKLTGKAIIQVAAKHNHREIAAEIGVIQGGHIDPGRIRDNIILRGHSTAAGVAGMAQSLMDKAGVKSLRKDAVRALEIIFSLPPESVIEHQRFFDDAVTWTERYFDAPVISAIIHNDESAPHCHALLLPLVRGRMIGSDLMGNRTKLQALQSDFYAQVGQRYGLTRQAPQKRLNAAVRRSAVESAYITLEANSGLTAAVLRVLVEPHVNNPEPLMLALNLDLPKVAVKGSFVAIMTKACKPDKPIGFRNKKPIGFDDDAPEIKEQTLSCVGFPNIAPVSQPTIQHQTVADDDYVREREGDHAASTWNSETGEYVQRRKRVSSKPQVLELVRSALDTHSTTKHRGIR
jgi:hypothetical protein